MGANGARQEAMLGAVWPTAPQVDGALATSGTARATARACMAYRAGQWLQARATWHALAPLTHSDRPHRASKGSLAMPVAPTICRDPGAQPLPRHTVSFSQRCVT